MTLLKLDEAGLAALVRAFYARVRRDAELGPVFNEAVSDWPAHLDTLTAFWSSVMLASGRYGGRPVPAHFRHRDRISPALFSRWLALWGQTADELMEPQVAQALKLRAARIGQSLQFALFARMEEGGAPPSSGLADRGPP
ncbi:group III truncated hemoglobin [Ancylobacter oerskovii]|uniref:Group III truncated hemoglobin n=1 Tax=Ancylobacter oerskovii TaxID=459519 RepID=A0ABW4YZJ0_9HYPH|nr:group III truncated hemoglobin [Ancylobacter oerskovii]MBS7543885.1 group III truncated hemoglobin [Ancylobacter oerskovii]